MRLKTSLFGLDNLAVLIVATVRAHTMRKLCLTALRANGTCRLLDAVMHAATLMGADTAHSLFRYCHCNTPSICASYRNTYHVCIKHAKRYSSKDPTRAQAAFFPSSYLLKRGAVQLPVGASHLTPPGTFEVPDAGVPYEPLLELEVGEGGEGVSLLVESSEALVGPTAAFPFVEVRSARRAKARAIVSAQRHLRGVDDERSPDERLEIDYMVVRKHVELVGARVVLVVGIGVFLSFDKIIPLDIALEFVRNILEAARACTGAHAGHRSRYEYGRPGVRGVDRPFDGVCERIVIGTHFKQGQRELTFKMRALRQREELGRNLDNRLRHGQN